MIRLYSALLLLLPRRLRETHGGEMLRVMQEMAADAQVPRRRLWLAVLTDAVHALVGGAWTGLLCGALVLTVWYVFRADPGPGLGLPVGLGVISLLLAAAGFLGARRSGSLAGGFWSGLVAGLVSALTVFGDALFFGRGIGNPVELVLTMCAAAGVVMTIVTVGALLAGTWTRSEARPLQPPSTGGGR